MYGSSCRQAASRRHPSELPIVGRYGDATLFASLSLLSFCEYFKGLIKFCFREKTWGKILPPRCHRWRRRRRWSRSRKFWVVGLADFVTRFGSTESVVLLASSLGIEWALSTSRAINSRKQSRLLNERANIWTRERKGRKAWFVANGFCFFWTYNIHNQLKIEIPSLYLVLACSKSLKLLYWEKRFSELKNIQKSPSHNW